MSLKSNIENLQGAIASLKDRSKEIYDAGFAAGQAQGGGGSDDGFWDAIQGNGDRRGYPYTFYGFTDEIYNPKYPIVCDGVNSVSQGVSENYAAQQTFAHSAITDTKVPITLSGTRVNNTFDGCESLKKIPSLTLDSITRFSYPFRNCRALEELNLYGTIQYNGFDLSYSPNLKKASIENVVQCLSTETSGLQVTFSKTAVNREFETGEGKNDGSSSEEWLTLKKSKDNWTVALSEK